MDLCHNPFGDKGCLSLANYLCQPGCPLRSLSIAGCLDVDPAAWKTINAGVGMGKGKDPPRPGDDGAVSLAAALVCPHGCPLRYADVVCRRQCNVMQCRRVATACATLTLERTQDVATTIVVTSHHSAPSDLFI